MSRIDAPGSSPLSPEPTLPEPDAPAPELRVGTTASRRTSVSESSASAPGRNELRPYDGPSVAPSSPRPSTHADGPAVSARELAAMGGRLRSPSVPVPEDVYSSVRSHLTRSLSNPFLTDSDVKATHDALGSVPRDAYRATLDRMDRDGLLSTYVSRMDAPSRRSFLEQAASNGVLSRRPGGVEGPLGMPGRPETFVNDPKLPAALRDAVNAHATDTGRAAVVAYDAYLQRYGDAVAQAGSLQALRVLGPPQSLDLRETSLGLSWSDPQRERYESEWKAGLGRPQHSLVQAYEAVTARAQVLSGERPAGAFVSAEASASHEMIQFKRTAHASARGTTDVQTQAGIASKAGPLGLEVMMDAHGKTEAQLQMDLGIASVSRDSEGKVELSLGAGPHARAYAALNPRTAEFGGGVSFEVSDKSGQSRAGLKLGYGLRGLTPERASQAVRNDVPGLFSRPKDLDPGVSWEALPSERRALYERQGWTREEWAQDSRR
ncbi:hypothetical protein [Corallococcus exiguus]|uniref:Uncharacterized protein n=1 Tax=Corallococcus exiguus TaxID=83462 RepID=A0A7X4YGE6_9BACT|nr:hypothetical protein [Corallococcus exiguus]NBC44945.1 hypothetical protein [Corallococcus exiguus]TNV62673.1 hypothetical protein FH620_17340 [Corallococcus exiguus]